MRSRNSHRFYFVPTFAPSIVTQNPSEVSDGSLMSEKVPISALLPHKTQKKMQTKIQVFKNKVFGEVRTMTNERGETFFVGKDVAMALGYKNTTDALRKHVDTEDKGTIAIRDAAYETRAVIINEMTTGGHECLRQTLSK